jgi:hypothetical protein
MLSIMSFKGTTTMDSSWMAAFINQNNFRWSNTGKMGGIKPLFKISKGRMQKYCIMEAKSYIFHR